MNSFILADGLQNLGKQPFFEEEWVAVSLAIHAVNVVLNVQEESLSKCLSASVAFQRQGLLDHFIIKKTFSLLVD